MIGTSVLFPKEKGSKNILKCSVQFHTKFILDILARITVLKSQKRVLE